MKRVSRIYAQVTSDILAHLRSGLCYLITSNKLGLAGINNQPPYDC